MPALPRATQREDGEGSGDERDHRPHSHAPRVGGAGRGNVGRENPIDAQVDSRHVLKCRRSRNEEDDQPECAHERGSRPGSGDTQAESGAQKDERDRGVDLHGQRARQQLAQPA